MKSFSRANLFLASLLGFAGLSAQAEDDSATFWVDHDVLRFESRSLKPDEGDTQKTSELVTTPNDVTIGIFWKDYGLYVTPGNAGAAVAGSYYPTKEIEVGLNLGLFSRKVEDETVNTTPATTRTTDTKTTRFGLFGTYYLPVHAKATAEFTLAINMSSTKATIEPAGGSETTVADSKGTEVVLTAQYALEIAKHFAYVPGIVISSVKDKDDQNNTDSKTTAVALNIAHFRYIF